MLPENKEFQHVTIVLPPNAEGIQFYTITVLQRRASVRHPCKADAMFYVWEVTAINS